MPVPSKGMPWLDQAGAPFVDPCEKGSTVQEHTAGQSPIWRPRSMDPPSGLGPKYFITALRHEGAYGTCDEESGTRQRITCSLAYSWGIARASTAQECTWGFQRAEVVQAKTAAGQEIFSGRSKISLLQYRCR
jgi:hypothetical protein